MKKENILLVGSYGRGNIGDDVFLLVALKFFADKYNLFINSADDSLLPSEVKGKINTIATTGSRDFLKKFKLFLSLRHVIYFGGDLWAVLYGDKFPRQSLYKMLIVNVLCRLFGKQIHYIGCGVGKMEGYSLSLAKLTAKLARTIVVREARSAKLLGLGNTRVFPDLAINTTLPTIQQTKNKKFTIGVALLYYVPEPKKNFDFLIAEIEKALKQLPQDEIKVVLLPMLQNASVDYDDVWASKQLAAKLDCEVEFFQSREIGEYLSFLQGLDVMIGVRLHANILATLSGTPTLGVAYRPKVEQFFAQSKLGNYCVGLNDFELPNLSSCLLGMYRNYAGVKKDFVAAGQNLQNQAKDYEAYIESVF